MVSGQHILPGMLLTLQPDLLLRMLSMAIWFNHDVTSDKISATTVGVVEGIYITSIATISAVQTVIATPVDWSTTIFLLFN